MRHFVLRTLLFASPLLFYVLFITYADPFNFINTGVTAPVEVKRPIANQLNPCFWKMNIYKHQPESNLLLGDSRMANIPTEMVEKTTGERYFNFAYGGASLREIIDSFWFAANHSRLRNVYLGLNLPVYNDYNITDRAKTYLTISENPTLYFVNRTVLESSLYVTYSYATGKDLKLGAPNVDKEAFWRHELDEVDANYFKNYVYPKHYLEELRKIAAFCKQQGIKLTFIIFPTHTDVQNLITRYGLDEFNQQFRTDLASLATVYDFDFPNQTTSNKENFADPDHAIAWVNELIVKEVWQGTVAVARRYGP